MNGKISHVPPFGNTLIIGAGPAAIHVAVNISRGWCDKLGLLNRKGTHSVRLKEELQQSHYTLTSKVQGEKYSHLSGEAQSTHFYEGFDHIEDIWQTLILCTPSDTYSDIINAVRLDSLKEVKTILLISPGIGSNLLVNSQLKQSRGRMNVISFSNYYAATKFESGNPSKLTSFTKAFKKRIYVASNQQNSASVFNVQCFIESLGIQCTILSNPIEAESRNITTYVHPPFFINEVSLNEIFNKEVSNKYMYKIYPEGPITQHSIRAMVSFWREISGFIQHLGAKPFNLIKFLNDDNYPVHEMTLSREDIENFMALGQIKQEYLLYIRYSSLLIDPFSTPDENGKYFDFSSIPFKQVYQDQNGKWVLPRIPLEDYKKIKLIYGLAQKTHHPMPQTLELIELFDRRLNQFIKENGKDLFYPEIFMDTTQNDAEAIFTEMERG